LSVISTRWPFSPRSVLHSETLHVYGLPFFLSPRLRSDRVHVPFLASQVPSAPYRLLPSELTFGRPVFGSTIGSWVLGSIATPAAWARFHPASSVVIHLLDPPWVNLPQYPVQ
jgi:hypothetical protein